MGAPKISERKQNVLRDELAEGATPPPRRRNRIQSLVFDATTMRPDRAWPNQIPLVIRMKGLANLDRSMEDD